MAEWGGVVAIDTDRHGVRRPYESAVDFSVETWADTGHIVCEPMEDFQNPWGFRLVPPGDVAGGWYPCRHADDMDPPTTPPRQLVEIVTELRFPVAFDAIDWTRALRDKYVDDPAQAAFVSRMTREISRAEAAAESLAEDEERDLRDRLAGLHQMMTLRHSA